MSRTVLVALCFLSWYKICFSSENPAQGQIIFSAVPDSTEFYINGLRREPDADQGFSVEPGMLLIEIKQNRVVVYSTLVSVEPSEKKHIELDCTKKCALLHVMTEPSGATLSMNGIILGTTPYLNRFIAPGTHSIMATYPGHIPVIRRIELTPDGSPLFSYVMEQTQTVKDSVTAAARAMRHRRQTIQKSVFGACGLIMAAAGAYYDWKAYGHLVESAEASKAYDQATTKEQFELMKESYNRNRDQARKPILYRNIFYGAAGFCLAGFYVSFIF